MKLHKPHYYILFFVALPFIFEACSKSETASSIPALEYTGYSITKAINGKDSFVTLNMTFVDGDGDVGLSEADSFPPFRFGFPNFYNLLVEFYTVDSGNTRKITSQFLQDPITADTVNFNQRITNLTPEGRDKFIKGKIKVLTPFTLTLDYSKPLPDSVFYTITLLDRSLNYSNTLKTPIIVLNL